MGYLQARKTHAHAEMFILSFILTLTAPSGGAALDLPALLPLESPTCQQGAHPHPHPHPTGLPITPQYRVGFQAFSLKLSHSTCSHHGSESHMPKLIELQFLHAKIVM